MLPLKSTYVCIMAGGSGERFWPMSRQQKPKHLLSLLSDKTLLEQTVGRVESVVPSDHIFILTNQAQKSACQEVLPHFTPLQLIAEPAKRDTAAACALGTALVHRLEPGAVVIFLAADALIQNGKVFAEQLTEAAQWAQQHEASFL